MPNRNIIGRVYTKPFLLAFRREKKLRRRAFSSGFTDHEIYPDSSCKAPSLMGPTYDNLRISKHIQSSSPINRTSYWLYQRQQEWMQSSINVRHVYFSCFIF
jgi:hypothetical protein